MTVAVIEQVREGMPVVGADGKKAGRVEDLKMGDPEAVAAEGQAVPETGGAGGLIDDFVQISRLPRHVAERLLRLGYVKIDRPGLFAGHEYVAADELDRVEDGTLWLKAGQRADQ
ncbi:hypothetical protein [Sinomonas terrae]|uniref:DUF2171 domain-containing protein n=1 Tax=Sinomonas terrae TaxID=2908838 RepID=A0ABS9U386_9MICC|nr:hypothetical protein [Sinomonas terrae]MCH6471171.1 hypothetical protein [Sinomonas terrae]